MHDLFPSDLLDDAKRLLAALERRALLIATAESCTGGLLAGLLTEVPGAAMMVERGFVTYSNAAKTEVLGVDTGLLARFGAVSEEAGRAMAEGALGRSAAHIALAVTGIAGPDGGSTEKPVGLVHLAVARKGAPSLSRECRFGNIGRRGVRLASLKEAVALAQEALDQSPS